MAMAPRPASLPGLPNDALVASTSCRAGVKGRRLPDVRTKQKCWLISGPRSGRRAAPALRALIGAAHGMNANLRACRAEARASLQHPTEAAGNDPAAAGRSGASAGRWRGLRAPYGAGDAGGDGGEARAAGEGEGSGSERSGGAG